MYQPEEAAREARSLVFNALPDATQKILVAAVKVEALIDRLETNHKGLTEKEAYQTHKADLKQALMVYMRDEWTARKNPEGLKAYLQNHLDAALFNKLDDKHFKQLLADSDLVVAKNNEAIQIVDTDQVARLVEPYRGDTLEDNYYSREPVEMASSDAYSLQNLASGQSPFREFLNNLFSKLREIFGFSNKEQSGVSDSAGKNSQADDIHTSGAQLSNLESQGREQHDQGSQFGADPIGVRQSHGSDATSQDRPDQPEQDDQDQIAPK